MSGFALVITDTSPLITLARANRLDLLLELDAPVEIPDVVFFEATREGFADGSRLTDWINRHAGAVRIVPTSRSREWLILRKAGERARGFDELAAIEVVDAFCAAHPGQQVLLLCEDADLRRYQVAGAALLVTTGTLLLELERAGRIRSADRVIDEALAAGPNVEQQRGQPASETLRTALNHPGRR